jgi:outer membrane protein
MNFYKSLTLGLLGASLIATSCKDKKNATASKNTVAVNNESTSTKIAYINLDSLDSRYQYILDGKKKFEAEQKKMEDELKSLEQAIKNQYSVLQKKINDKSISEVEYEQMGKKIQSMEQNYQQKAQSLSGQLMAKTDSFQTDYRKKIDDFLIAYNANGKYDYILSYQYGAGLVLFANKTLDITQDVVEGLNKQYLAEKSKSE